MSEGLRVEIGRIENVHVDTVNITLAPDAAEAVPPEDLAAKIQASLVGYEHPEDVTVPELLGTVPPEVLQYLWEQIDQQLKIGADPESLRETGFGDVSEQAATPEEEELTPEEQAASEQVDADRYYERHVTRERIDALARAGHLRNLSEHVSKARKYEGFATNHAKDRDRHPDKPDRIDELHAEELTMAEEALVAACAHCMHQGDCRLERKIERWIDIHPYRRDNTGKRRPGSTLRGEVESQLSFLTALAEDPQTHCDPVRRK
jgi:hypothetical protein